MKNLVVKGIVISESNMGDFDKMLTILTPNLGKINCSARGARRPKSTLMAGSQFLCFGEYMLFKGSDIYTINSINTIELFYNIRTDLDKLMYASYITKIINDITTENQNSFNTLKLFLNTIYAISETDKDLDFVVTIFKLRLLKILGFMPEVSKCVTCGERENISFFSIRDNGFKCSKCAKLDNGAIEISSATVNSIKYALGADSKKIFSFTISKETLKELKLVVDLYFNEKLEKEYKMETF